MKESTKRYLSFILVGTFCFIIGFAVGFYSAVRFMINQAVAFLQAQGINFSIEGKQIADLIVKYQHLLSTGGSGTI